MHEYSVALNIADLVTDYSRGKKVESVHLSVGALSSIFFESLEMYLKLVFEDKGFDNIQITYESVPATFLCGCGRKYEVTNMAEGCPACGRFQRRIIGGKDCRVERIEVEDE